MSKEEERLTEFVNRLCEDYDKIQATFPGLRKGQIITMLCQFDYVQEFCLVPLFCRIESKLPKGYKKTDGIKIITDIGHGSRYHGKTTDYLVECGNELYVGGVIRKRSKKKSERNQWLVVEEWKEKTAMEVIGRIEADGKIMNINVRDAIIQLYKDKELPLGMQIYCLKNI